MFVCPNGRKHTRAIMCIKSLIMVAKMIVVLTKFEFKFKCKTNSHQI